MDHFEQFGRSKGPQGFAGFGGFGRRGGGRDRFFKKGNLQFIILQMLEDRDFVSISKEGNKKIYTITDEGKTFLKENVDQDEEKQKELNVFIEETKQKLERFYK